MKSISVFKQNRQIIDRYFKSYLPIQASELIQVVNSEHTLSDPRYKIVDTDLTTSNLTQEKGFTADPKIINLVVSFNRLGYNTIDSCEGHLDRGNGFPRVSFWASELYEILSIINDWGKVRNINDVALISGEGVKESNRTYFSLTFITRELKESQDLAQELSDFINSKSS